ncbi:MAG: DNA polymerase I, partial [Deltaproteobacteria bacterium]|nr:DNA polymerase I [Deltaproteobacteria bacterium]
MAQRESQSGRPVLTLIDASGYIFRAYHAIQHLSTSRGVPTNAVYGFTRMLLKTLREFDPTHVALAFDKESRKGRQAIDPTYKAHREAPPPDLVPQFALIRRVVEVLDLPVLEFEGWEADDVIGTVAHRAREAGFDVFVITGDKDFVQLLDEGVRLYDPMHDRHTGPAEAEARYGIPPSKMRDYLALVGDASDNVAKVPGVGPKTAVELLQQFGSVEGLLARVDEVSKPKIREAVRSHGEQLRRALQLVSFRLDLPLEVDVRELTRRPIRQAEAKALFGDLEFFRLLQEMPADGSGVKPRAEDSPAQPAAAPVPDVEVLTSPAGLAAWAEGARRAGTLTLVPAFQGLPLEAPLVGLGLALPDGRAAYVPLRHGYLGVPRQLEAAEFREQLGGVLRDPSVRKRGHDLKTLALLLAGLDLPLSGPLEDAELLSYLLNPSRREHALADLSRERLQRELPALPGGPHPGKRERQPGDLAVEEAAAAFGQAADAARRLVDLLWPDVERSGLTKLARDMELPLVPILARMEQAGIALDLPALSGISSKVEAECSERMATIERLAGHPVNVNSPPQLAALLFEELGLPVVKRGKTGPSTDQEVLEKLAEQHPLPREVIEFRAVQKLKTTYLDTLPGLLGRDGRLHTSFHQAATATGRLSSTDPNLQNIPIRTPLGAEIRRAFVAAPGNLLVSADYSQVELRLLAHVSGDEGLLKAFREDADVHARTAAEVFGVPEADVSREQRSAAKMVNFGIAYGLSAHGLSARLAIGREEAASIIQRYFERYGGIRRYLDDTVEKAKRDGYVETLFGRRRYMPEINSRNRAAAQAAERAAINMPIQGTAADLVKLAMIRVDAALADGGLRTRMLLQVHDELLFEAPEDEVARVEGLARACMAGVAELKVPLRVDVG